MRVGIRLGIVWGGLLDRVGLVSLVCRMDLMDRVCRVGYGLVSLREGAVGLG